MLYKFILSNLNNTHKKQEMIITHSCAKSKHKNIVRPDIDSFISSAFAFFAPVVS